MVIFMDFIIQGIFSTDLARFFKILKQPWPIHKFKFFLESILNFVYLFLSLFASLECYRIKIVYFSDNLIKNLKKKKKKSKLTRGPKSELFLKFGRLLPQISIFGRVDAKESFEGRRLAVAGLKFQDFHFGFAI
jgi:hypothetical protein